MGTSRSISSPSSPVTLAHPRALTWGVRRHCHGIVSEWSSESQSTISLPTVRARDEERLLSPEATVLRGADQRVNLLLAASKMRSRNQTILTLRVRGVRLRVDSQLESRSRRAARREPRPRQPSRAGPSSRCLQANLFATNVVARAAFAAQHKHDCGAGKWRRATRSQRVGRSRPVEELSWFIRPTWSVDDSNRARIAF